MPTINEMAHERAMRKAAKSGKKQRIAAGMEPAEVRDRVQTKVERYAAPSFTAKGTNGRVTVDEDFVTISRDTWGAALFQGYNGDKRIPIAAISAVQFREGPMTCFIQFTVAGSEAARTGVTIFFHNRAVKDAWKDENTITFYPSQADDFYEVRRRVETMIAARYR
jgi:hypothetical protein